MATNIEFNYAMNFTCVYSEFGNYLLETLSYNKVFRLPKSLFIQGVCFYCTGSLLVGAIPPTNREPVQQKQTPWIDKLLRSRNTLYMSSFHRL